ncbi:PREDICTED: uncharacterized protein LOC104821068 isoform X2 [Tarenaya hassleriana]|uniref:uncharacterized protein LOC104821068 isoform X2 n=1 Tax=Tarenaya hassleriana TaxID=28532 RepID=UPI00053C91E5|nr:PREDICTED: uncharacterized protein LOC104821068 isoform X2 [Tarenaya hassleriana]
MEDEKDVFYVVRKGDMIGVYRSLSECLEQAGSSVCHPSMSVYKGYGWPTGAEEFLSSFGLRNAIYSINAGYVKDDVFGKLIPCPIQEPSSSQGGALDRPSSSKRLKEMVQMENLGRDGSTSLPQSPPQKHLKIDNCVAPQVTPSNCESCTIEFDGASKGNPGKAGSGAVLRSADGNVFLLREGIGVATNNVAEYKGLILGMKVALEKGFKHVRVQGDSMLVCMQVQDQWKTKHPKMAELCKQAKELKNRFSSFHIQHVDREFNSDADVQANKAIYLLEGQTQTEEVCGGKY